MKNASIILLSAGVLFVGFSLVTPLLFFLIGAMLDKSFDVSALLQMEYALIAFVGLLMLILGSIFSKKVSPTIIISSTIALLAIVVSPKVSSFIVTGCYYLSLLTAFSVGSARLHREHS
ncbi:MAG: hypothetical protein RBR15_07785 [Sphaerochaeta sp.]|nr:hypothetical protein [Sphaerochaeta sp.]